MLNHNLYLWLNDEITKRYQAAAAADRARLAELTAELKSDIEILKKLLIERSLPMPGPYDAEEFLRKEFSPSAAPEFEVRWGDEKPNPNLDFVDEIYLKGERVAVHLFTVHGESALVNDWGETVLLHKPRRIPFQIAGTEKLSPEAYKILILLTDPEARFARFRRILDGHK